MGKKRHPIRGLLSGLLLGIGAAAMVILYGQAWFGQLTPWIVIGVIALLGLLLGILGPTRGARKQ